jgi:malic enzyme
MARNCIDFGEDAFIPSIFDERLLIDIPYAVAEAAILSNNTKKTNTFLKNYKQYLQNMRTDL